MSNLYWKTCAKSWPNCMLFIQTESDHGVREERNSALGMAPCHIFPADLVFAWFPV